ncbi:MAG TPA: nucleoside triphosphate pyrophosphohydrolase [Thermoanaerobaculia bacterium]|nr:nucleoside triphosphate pyrophosphohydrolase [Thermoanaerobaculia bacterium]
MTTEPQRRSSDLARLIDLVTRLRAPDGCPWDREQTLPDLRAYLLEEAHETAAAIDGGDPAELAGELGDLLFQVAFLTRLAEERGWFGIADVIDRIESKMIDRHPHVFGDDRLADARAVREAWERRKLRTESNGRESLLDGAAAAGLPALVAAYRLTQKAAGVGFDWPDADAVFAKLEEEIGELRHEVASAGPAPAPEARERLRGEVGDLLFAAANLARHLGLDPEAALAGTNLKFRRRFAAIERGLAARGRRLEEATLEEMDELWEEAKRAEAVSPPPRPAG